MTARLYKMPAPGPVLNDDETLRREWHAFFAGIEDISKRVSTSLAPTSGATLSQLEVQLNAVLAALKVAGLMKAP
jgi:hypothetical protein